MERPYEEQNLDYEAMMYDFLVQTSTESEQKESGVASNSEKGREKKKGRKRKKDET